MALELRPNCEYCDVDLGADSVDARICSYECTFCATCVEHVLDNVCPNCGGGFSPRPIRPVAEWRTGVSRSLVPPSTKRRTMSYSLAECNALTAQLRHTPPQER